jgi:hypothetical protein
MKCLEVSRTSVKKSYHNIIMLDYLEISSGEFSVWSMVYMLEACLTHPINLKFCGTPEFEPYDMSGESAHEMMLDLKDNVPVV